MPLKSISIACAFFMCVPLGRAQAQTQNEYQLWSRFPAQLLRDLRGDPADESGRVKAARGMDFIDPQQQRDGIRTLLVGAILGDDSWVQEGLRVADATFATQHPDGSVGFSKGYTETSDAFFLYTAAEAFNVLRESPMGGRYSGQLNRYKPVIAQALQWLSQPQHVQAMIQQSGTSPNRDFNIALSFAECRAFLGQSPWSPISQDFVDRGMRLFRAEDGVFIEEPTKEKMEADLATRQGGGDSSYQAVSLLHLDMLYGVYGKQEVLPVLQAGVQWEIARVEPSGEVSVQGNTRTGLGQEQLYGHAKGVNYNEVIQALELYCVITNDRNVCGAAAQVARFRFHH